MEYFTLNFIADNKETGFVFPQTIFNNPKKFNPNPVLLANQAIDGVYPPDNILPFDYLELNKDAKLTDLMSSSLRGNGFLISQKLKTILEEANIKDYKFYDVKLFDEEKEIKGYCYFHSASCLRNYINYEKSKFYIGDILRNYIRDLGFIPTKFDDLEKHQKDLPYAQEVVCVKQFYLSNSFPFNLDLFLIRAYNYDFFISKRLKEKIEENKITGVLIKSIGDLIKTPALA